MTLVWSWSNIIRSCIEGLLVLLTLLILLLLLLLLVLVLVLALETDIVLYFLQMWYTLSLNRNELLSYKYRTSITKIEFARAFTQAR